MTRELRTALIAFIALSPLSLAQVQLEFVPKVFYLSALQLRNGDRLLVGSAPRANNLDSSQLVITVLGSHTYTDSSLAGSGNTVPNAAALDSTGNIWIVGNTDSDDFNLVNPIAVQKVPYRTAGFALELSPAGDKVLFATYLCGSKPPVHPFETFATAFAADSAGNVYIGGRTDDPDFPTTRGAFLPGGATITPFQEFIYYSFLLKIGTAGKLVYSTLVTTAGGCADAGSACIGHQSSYADVNSLSVDVSGAVIVAGILGGTYHARSYYIEPGGGYICRVAPDGSKLLWTTHTPTTYGPVNRFFAALNTAGNVDLFGSYVPVISSLPPVSGTPGLFAAQLKSDGSGFAYSKDLGQSTDAHAAGLLLDSQGYAYLAGTSSSPQFPQTGPGVPGLGTDFILKIDSSGTPVHPPLRLPRGVVTASPSMNGSGSLVLLGTQGSLLTVPVDYYGLGPPAVVAFANSASYQLNAGLFSGALVTLYGFGLPGPAEGVEVKVNGTPAPILYAGPNQINFQVPFNLPSYPSAQPVQLVWPAGNVSVQLPLGQSLGLFTTDGAHAAALNQDGTVNSESNPAAVGAVVSLFGTGAIWPPDTQEGAVPTSALAFNPDVNQFEAFSSKGTPLNIFYAGTAPGIIDGVFEINVQMTATTPDPPGAYQITLRRSSTLNSNVVQVHVR
jgi:uncharacterized protein (TIGR03437 family)